MDVRLLQLYLRMLLLLALAWFSGIGGSLFGQSGSPYKPLETSVNVPVTDTLSGVNLSVFEVSPVAAHGDVDINLIQPGGSGAPNVYVVQYTPNTGFIGVDTFHLEFSYQGTFPYLIYKAYRVTVQPSLILLQPDYAISSGGAPVNIPVLNNDITSNGSLTVTGLPSVNHGSATVNGSNVVRFTPAPGFVGTAHVNYVACDAVNNCRTGYASIGVNTGAVPPNDTLVVGAAKNQPVTMPLSYNSYTVFQAPGHGLATIDQGQVFTYMPETNYTGPDQFVLSANVLGSTTYKTVLVTVLPTPTQNNMALEDVVYTPKGQPITFNVRDNDIGNLSVKSWVQPNSSHGAISGMQPNGNVTFTPAANFTGVATFYYRIGNQFVNDLEMAAVNVVVSNLPPSRAEFHLTTPVGTPMVINYQIPFTGFNFSVIDPPAHGTYQYYPGFSTQSINGQAVTGFNLFVYTPNSGYVGADQFELDYCVSANNQCQTVKIHMDVVEVDATDPPYCVDDCVWPGDANHDGIANNRDLLPLGYLMGAKGQTRPSATLEWYGQYAPDWNDPFNGLAYDLKHVDADGNGWIEADDAAAIELFYSKQDQVTPAIPPLGKGLPWFFTNLTPNAAIGDLMRIEVALGSPNFPVTNLYGFALDVNVSPLVVDSALQMVFYDNTWINRNAPTLTLSENPYQGRLEAAFTRSNGLNVHGQGVIGELNFIIIDIVVGGKLTDETTLTLTLENPAHCTGDGQVVSGETQTFEFPVRLNPGPRPAGNGDFFVYPSPASDLLQVHLNGADLIEALTLFDATGRAVYQSGSVQWEHAELSVRDLPSGVYVAHARTTSGQVVKKFQILR